MVVVLRYGWNDYLGVNLVPSVYFIVRVQILLYILEEQYKLVPLGGTVRLPIRVQKRRVAGGRGEKGGPHLPHTQTEL